MTRKEERREAVKTITSNQQCNGLSCWQCKEYCAMQAIEWADKTMIDKACEWLMKYKDNYAEFNVKTDETSVSDEIVYDFKKAMEE